MALFGDAENYYLQYSNFFPTLTANAKLVDAGQAKPDILDHGLAILQNYVADYAGKVAQVRSDLELFDNFVREDKTRFETDRKTADRKYTGSQGELGDIRTKFDSLTAALEADNTIIARGAIKAVPGAIGIGIAVALKYLDLPGSSTVLDSSVKWIKNADQESVNAMKDSDGKVQELKATIEKLKGEELEMALLAAISSQVRKFAARIDDDITSLKTLEQSWTDLANKFYLLSNYSSPPPGFFQAQLDQGRVAAVLLNQFAQRYQQALQNISQQPDVRFQAEH